MTEDDIEYFQHRAEVELEMAQRAVTPEVMVPHVELANAYLEQVEALKRSASEQEDGGSADAPEGKSAADAASGRPHPDPTAHAPLPS
ncbi:hypothetical protein ACFSC3_13325 [Sphingomonas floccifaciens]|uniref:Uncharacterized protein n=1 Tax=Sphingomonas floccifaciens TaxID=1844115 RepID=A0ABW4NF40_9SPHN